MSMLPCRLIWQSLWASYLLFSCSVFFLEKVIAVYL